MLYTLLVTKKIVFNIFVAAPAETMLQILFISNFPFSKPISSLELT